ncbi:MarR family transcriptional regulator [Candidatus Woesearchaeota archaeon]|nr:MarR family transcriptional regulator [Candidatus Woesearchaeota archaeon]
MQTKTIGAGLLTVSIILLFILAFVKVTTDEQARLLCESAHEQGIKIQDNPAHKSNLSWLLTIAFGITFIMLGVGIYLMFFYKAGEKALIKPVDLSRLDANEKQVYEFVKAREGSAYQSDIIKEMGLSKVRMTRILDKMESKGILEKKRRGMTNIVVLK